MSDFKQQVEFFRCRQEELAGRCVIAPVRRLPRFIAGADCAFSVDKQSIFAVAVVWDRLENATLEVTRAKQAVTIPYVPGFLSFREGPALHEAIGKLKTKFDAVLFDGQGIAHPRACGLATHMGVELNAISIGAAKSLLVGEFDEPGKQAESQSRLQYRGRRVGTVLRTRAGVRPLFISIGHRIDLPSATRIVLACCKGFRMPEPTRLADQLVGQYKAECSILG